MTPELIECSATDIDGNYSPYIDAQVDSLTADSVSCAINGTVGGDYVVSIKYNNATIGTSVGAPISIVGIHLDYYLF